MGARRTYTLPRLRGFLVINPSAGDAEPTAASLREEAERKGIAVHVLREGDDVARIAREADADALGMAGGDGSLAAVAEVAIERDLPFVCIPFGTRNHFARDVGLDRDDPFAGLGAFEGAERRIDVGRVGDRVFLNNVSLGLYARLVHRRERHRRRRQALAHARALALVIRRRRELGITIDGERISARVVMVANNAYRLDLLSVGERDRLDEGVLHLYAFRGLLRSGWDDRAAARFTVDSRAHMLAAAVDGEPTVLETPLEFTAAPRALRLLVPPATMDA